MQICLSKQSNFATNSPIASSFSIFGHVTQLNVKAQENLKI